MSQNQDFCFITKFEKNIKLALLAMLILLGIFLRTYNFHRWLDFGSDQVKDAEVVSRVVDNKDAWPGYGPDMGNSGSGGRQNRFRLGPMYYDWEILSAKIFGDNAVSLAFPDALFGILSLPLFYVFVRKIFGINISLILLGVFAVSFYALTFSHSAWNVNSIPFFSLLLFVSLYEFSTKKEKTAWWWLVLLGVALGVGMQLHAILLILFPATIVCAYVLFLRGSFKQTWPKLALVLLVAFFLNWTQFVTERDNNFKNTKVFFQSATGSSVKSSDGAWIRTALAIDCNVQANAYMLLAIGGSDCDYSPVAMLDGQANARMWEKDLHAIFFVRIIIYLVVSIGGFYLLLKEIKISTNQNRKVFLKLLVLYSFLSFLIILPVLDSALRYFVHIFFVPLIFLGLFLEYVNKKIDHKKFVIFAAAVVGIIIVANLHALQHEISTQFVDSRIVLGQVEDMAQYLVAQSDGVQTIQLITTGSSDAYFRSLQYVLAKKGKTLERDKGTIEETASAATFYLSDDISKDNEKFLVTHNQGVYQVFNQVAIFKLDPTTSQ